MSGLRFRCSRRSDIHFPRSALVLFALSLDVEFHCMAGNPKRGVLASVGKRVVSQIWSASSRDRVLPAVAFSTGAHFSVYDKNPDDQLRASVVPDDLIQPQSDNYWAPHPQTGVFGPAAGQTAATTAGAGGRERGYPANVNGGGGTVLEEKAWFRPTSLEDLEKPQ